MRHSFAQNYEDVLLQRLFAGKADGFYVDVGASAPTAHNVSLNFYQRGWRGLNVEPIPERAQELRFCRPRDIVVEAAASDRQGVARFHRTAGAGGLSSLSSEFLQGASEFDVWPVETATRTLADILAEHAVEQIDFLKIDVEGAETQVIAGMDWRRWRPIVTLVEAVTPTRPPRASHQGWERALNESGYAFAYFDGLNRYYLREESRELTAHFATPANAFETLRRFEDFGDPLLNRAHPSHEFATQTGKMLLRALAGGGIDVGAAFLRDYAPAFLGQIATEAHVHWAVRQMLARPPAEGEAQRRLNGRELTVRQLLEEIFAGDEFRVACGCAAV